MIQLRPAPPRPDLLSVFLVAGALALLAAFAPLGAAFASEIAGDRAVEQGEFARATEAYGAAIERTPDDAELHADRARATTYLAERAEGDEAEALYTLATERARDAIALDPDLPGAHFELARALGRLAQFKGVLQSLGLADEMRAELERTLELDPDHASALHALALWHLEVPWIAGGRSGQVRPLMERAIELEPRAISHRVAYAEALLQLGDDAAAREQLEAALDLRAQTFLERQDRERAEELLDANF